MATEEWELRAIERELGEAYQIVRVLGRGAFGAVYLARERRLHRSVAIKALRADRASEDDRVRLLREARTIANLSHPAIVPLLSFGESAGTVYMVMPYIGGETLAERLEREPRLDPREVRRILIEVADALAYAHGEGVLHRDLKPENVLLEPAGAIDDEVPPRVRLIDFGVAAFPMRDPGVLAQAERWGTPQFMAPEQAFGEPELDPRSELYSLGILGFLLLGGRLPFEATTPSERLIQQQAGPRVPLHVRAPDAPPDLIEAIERCLAYEPAGRWRRARDLRDALVRGAEARPDAAPALSIVRQRLRDPRSLLRRRAAEGSAVAAAARRAAPAVPLRLRMREMFASLAADARFGARTLLNTPGFAAAVVITFAIGLAATTVMFSGIQALVLRPLPVADPASLVVLQERREGVNRTSSFGVTLFEYERYRAYREATERVLAGVAAQDLRSFAIRTGDRATPTTGLLTSDNYFEVLGISPALGRFYTGAQEELRDGVAVVGYDLWRREFGGDTAIVGRTIHIDSRPLSIVAVAPRGFAGAFGGVFQSEVWVPASSYARQPTPDDPVQATASPRVLVHVFARLRPGIEVGQASAALGVIGPSIPPENPRTRIMDAWVEPLSAMPGEMRAPMARFLTMMLAVAGLVLLIAATNAAGMLLARASARGREIATRLAIGAARARIVRQLMVESLMLCAAGGLAGVLLAWWLTRLLDSWQPPFPIEVAVDFGIDATVLAMAAVTVLGAGLLAGLAPAVHATRVDLATAMKEGGVASGVRRTRLRSIFVVAQVALSVVLLVVAGLFTRSLQRTLAVNPGFVAEGVVRGELNLASHGYERERARALLTELLERLRARPEIAAASLVRGAPLTGNVDTWGARLPGQPDDEQVRAQWGSATEGFIELLRVPMLAGRTFTVADDAEAPLATVINQQLAESLWPGEPPQRVIGREIESLDRRMTVVGVMANGKYTMLQEEPTGYGYVPFAQRFTISPGLYVRAASSDGTSAALLAARQELAALDPNIALERPTALVDDLARYLLPQRAGSFLVGTLGAIGLLLAATGLYGVLAYGVAQRMREFGVRLALGARAADVVRLVIRKGLILVAIGIAIGTAGGLAAGRLVSGFLFGLSPADPVTLIAVPLILLAVAGLASALPARRAAGADPMRALRAE